MSGLKKNSISLMLAFASIILPIVLVGSPSHAANPPGISIHGRILKPDGTALEGLNTEFKVQILTPNAAACVLYEETKVLDLSGSEGLFSFTMNDGTGVRTDTTGISFEKLFANRGTFTVAASNCASGNGVYSPGSTDSRNLILSFKDETMSDWEVMPSQPMNYVPLALEARQVGGYFAQSLMRVEDPTNGPQTVAPLTPTNFNDLMALLQGSSVQYIKASPQGAVLPSRSGATSAPNAGQMWFDSPTGEMKYWDGTGVKTLTTTAAAGVTSITAGAGLTGGTITTTGTIALATLHGSAGTGTKISYDVYGRVTGTAALAEADIPTLSTAGKVSGGAITSGTIGGSTAVSTTGTIAAAGMSTKTLAVFDSDSTNSVTIQTPATGVLTTNPTVTLSPYSMVFPTADGAAGDVLKTDGSGNLSWITLPNALVTSVAGKTGAVTLDNNDISGLGNAATKNVGTAAGTVAAGDDTRIVNAIQNAGATVSVKSGADAAKGAAATDGRVYIATDTQKIYRDDGSSWVTIASVNNSGGTVTNVTGTLPISVANGTTTPNISISQAGAATDGYLTSADWNVFNNKQPAGNYITSLTGDVTATGPGAAAASVVKIQGRAVASAAPLDGQVLKYIGGATNEYTPVYFSIGDLKTSLGATQFGNASCTADKTLTWSSLTDAFACQTIAIAGSQVTYASQTQKHVLAAPNAVDGVPSFRQLSMSDLTGTLAIANGGTGQTTAGAAFNALSPMTTLGDILYGGASGAGTRLAGNTTTTKKVLTQVGDGVNSAAPTWSALSSSDIPNLDASVITSGTLGVARGGTGAATLTTNQLLVGNGTSAISSLAAGSSGQMLTSAGAGANPAWTTATYPATVTANNLIYASANNTVGELTTANTSVLVTSNAGVPSWASGSTANRLLKTNGTTVSFAQASLSTDVTGTLPIGNGGTGQTTAGAAFNALSPMTTLGDILYGGASGAGTRLAGNTTTTKKVLTQVGDGVNSAAPTWSALSSSDIPNLDASVITSGTLGVARGGTGAATLSANQILVGNGTSAISSLSAGSSGQILTSAGAGSNPAWTTATYPATVTANNLIYASANNTVGQITTANSSVLVTSGAGAPSWASGAVANRLLRTDGTTVSFAQASLSTDVTGTLAIGNGGTGQTTAAAAFNALSPLTTLGDTLYGGASGAGTRLAGNTTTTRKFLTQTGDGTNSAAPTWSTISLSEIPNLDASIITSGTLGVARGGTGATTLTTNQLVVGNGTSALSSVAAGSSGQILTSTGAGSNPTWTTATYPATVTANNLIYASGNNAVGQITTANTSVLVTSSTGVPSWASGSTANRLLKTNGTTVSFAQASLSTDVTGTLPIGNGGTGQTTAAAAFNALSPMTTLGDILYGGASGAGTRLAGNTTTTRKFLAQTGDGTNSAAPTWSTLSSADFSSFDASNITSGVLAVARGGTGTGTGSITGVSGDLTFTAAAGNQNIVLMPTGTGGVSVGAAAPTLGIMLDVNGTIRTTDIVLTSDRRAKHNIRSLDNADSLRRICSLNPVSFNWNNTGTPDQGVIAQELKNIFPEFVRENSDGSYSVRYTSLIAPLISSVQELNAKNTSLQDENARLKQRLDAVEKQNQSMQDQIREIHKLLKAKSR